MNLRIAGIEYESAVDGPGLRTVLFCQGCLHHCEYCQNPQTWDFNGGMLFSVEDVYSFIIRNKHCKGITYTGGEPFHQAAALVELSNMLDGFEICAYTGYLIEDLLTGNPAQQELLSKLTVLIDGPFVWQELSTDLPYQGSRNQRILNVPASIRAGKAVLETDERWRPQMFYTKRRQKF